MIKYIYILIIFCFCFIVKSQSRTPCIYYNPNTNQTYDLNPIVSNSSYSKQFSGIIPLSNYVMYINFCGVPVSQCNERACQDSSNAGSLSVKEEVVYYSDPFQVMRIQYITSLLPIGDCAAASPARYRYTSIYMNCDPTQEFSLDSISEPAFCKYSVKASSKYVCRTCPLDCSGRGSCDPFYGTCTCNPLKSQWTGDACEISRLFISSSDSAYETTGDQINIYGYFGNFSSLTTKVLIGNQSCINPVVNSTNGYSSLRCFIGPGKGVHNITFIDDDAIVTGVNAFRYKPRVYECLNNCNNQGECDIIRGTCNCYDGFGGPDCLSINTNTTTNSTTGVDENGGSSSIGNENTNFFINIYSLVEYRVDGTIEKEYLLYNKWKQISTISTLNNNSIVTTFQQNLTTTTTATATTTNSSIQYTVEQILNHTKSYNFATQNFKVEPNSLKVTVSILSYNYQSSLNYLQLRISSTIDSNSSLSDDCRGTQFNVNGINDVQASNYITIKKQSKIFYGRFLPLMLSDNRPTFSSTSVVLKNSTSIIIGIGMSHCIFDCTIDPDFSLLVSSETYSCEKERKWFLPVVIIAPAVGAAIIVIISSILYRRHRTSLKIAAAAFKPAKLQNMN